MEGAYQIFTKSKIVSDILLSHVIEVFVVCYLFRSQRSAESAATVPSLTAVVIWR